MLKSGVSGGGSAHAQGDLHAAEVLVIKILRVQLVRAARISPFTNALIL